MAEKKTFQIDIEGKSIRELRKELKLLKDDLASATDPEDMLALARATAEVEDKMADVNEQIKIFASGSEFEQAGNALGAVKDGLLALDFGKAQERAAAFATVAKGITFKNAIDSVKQLGSTFVSVGKAVLTNPLFLIGAVIAGIVVVIYKLLDSLGLIEKAMEKLSQALDWVIGLFKDLSDWIGISNFAAQDAAEETAKAYEDSAARQVAAQQRVVQGLDNRIRLAKLEGKDVTELEREKRAELEKTAKMEYQASQARFEASLLDKSLTREEIAEIKEKARQSRLAYEQALSDTKFFEAEIRVAKQKETEKAQQDEVKSSDDAKKKADAARKEALAKAKAFAENRLKAERAIRDVQLEMMTDGLEKEIAVNEEKYKRLIQDTKNSETLLQSEKDLIISQFESLRTQRENEIRNERINKEREDQQKALQVLRDDYDRYLYGLVTDEKLIKERALDEELEKLKEYREAGIITEDEFNNRKREAEQKLQDDLEAMEQERIDKIKEEEEKALALRKQQFADSVANMSSSINAISNLMQTAQEAELNRAEGNEAAQEAIRKRSFEKNKKMQIGQAIMGAAQGVIAGLGAPFPMNIALPVIAGATGIANINKIKSASYQGGGGGAVSTPPSSIPNVNTPQRMGPNVNFQGNPNANNQVGAGGTQPMNITLQNQVSVSAVEMTSVQNSNATLAQSAEL